MPWTARDTIRHNKSAASNPKRSKAWAKIATDALKEYGDDGTAIRVANAAVKHMKGGGATMKGMRKPKYV